MTEVAPPTSITLETLKIHNIKYKNHVFKVEIELDYDETRSYIKILSDNNTCGIIIIDDGSPQCILQSFGLIKDEDDEKNKKDEINEKDKLDKSDKSDKSDNKLNIFNFDFSVIKSSNSGPI